MIVITVIKALTICWILAGESTIITQIQYRSSCNWGRYRYANQLSKWIISLDQVQFGLGDVLPTSGKEMLSVVENSVNNLSDCLKFVFICAVILCFNNHNEFEKSFFGFSLVLFYEVQKKYNIQKLRLLIGHFFNF